MSTRKHSRRSARLRNLFVYRGSIWYSRMLAGRRYRKNTGCLPSEQGWKDAAIWRDEYEAQKAIGAKGRPAGAVPTFAEMAVRYFESRKFTKILKPTTQQDRRRHLHADGLLISAFGRKRVDEITADALVAWWERESQARDWDLKTGFRYLASVAEVLRAGREYLRGQRLPTAEARERMAEESHTAAGRATQGDKRPIRDPAAIDALLEAARSQGARDEAFVLCLLDSGVRRGEAFALRWDAVAWGSDEDDPRRHLLVRASRSRDANEDTSTKSGRERRVALSRRLRRALGELYLSQSPRPRATDRVFEIDGNEADRLWKRVVDQASLPGLRMKDLRDTYGSWLLTLGVPIQYVSRQLGHGSIGVTQTHYAEYLGDRGDDQVYVEPPRLGPGEVVADLLSRLANCSQIAHKGDPFELPKFLQATDPATELEPAGVSTERLPRSTDPLASHDVDSPAGIH